MSHTTRPTPSFPIIMLSYIHEGCMTLELLSACTTQDINHHDHAHSSMWACSTAQGMLQELLPLKTRRGGAGLAGHTNTHMHVVHTHTHTYTCAHTHTHIRTHTYTQWYTHTYTHTHTHTHTCLLYTSPSPRDATLSRMPSSA